jgi:hypothetical protein
VFRFFEKQDGGNGVFPVAASCPGTRLHEAKRGKYLKITGTLEQLFYLTYLKRKSFL